MASENSFVCCSLESLADVCKGAFKRGDGLFETGAGGEAVTFDYSLSR